MTTYPQSMPIREQLDAIADRRVLILDGAMGSLIQARKLGEADFRGSRFRSHAAPLLGCNDLLCLTKPEEISAIHEAYLTAGADIIETCSFNATSLSLENYGIGELSYEISAAAAALAREAADKFSGAGKPRFVAGSMGPTAKSAGISPDINGAAGQGVTWDELAAAYYDNARGLLDGGADILLIETIFDTLNAKAAIFAVTRLMEERKIDIPVMISATVSGAAGRLLTGQTLEAFCVSILHANPWSVGLNCSFGAKLLKPHLKNLAAFAPCRISAYPNAGMPRQGEYEESPESMAGLIEEYLREGLVNIVGGCCGSTPAHIAAIAARAARAVPRPLPTGQPKTFLAGLQPLEIRKNPENAGIAGEITTLGDRELLGFINEGRYDDAVELARERGENGAPLIAIPMDDPPVAPEAMTSFIRLALSYPDLARRPFILESSRWNVLEGVLKCLPGKGLVKYTNPAEGDAEFLPKARLIRRYGAALLVKPDLRTSLISHGFPPEDIIIDTTDI